jgi:hypothetical protein
MKGFWLVYCAVLASAGVLLYAQGAAPGSGVAQRSGMGRGMNAMAGQKAGTSAMMGMHRDDQERLHMLMMSAYVLPNLKTELNLSAEQTANLERMKQELKSTNTDLSTKIAAKQKELDVALATEKGPTREQFQEVAALKADIQFNFVEAASKMRAMLNDTQRTKFSAMTPMDLHRAMMSSGNMQDRREMMQAMGEMPQGHVRGGAMPRGAMPGGKMMDGKTMGADKK